MRVWKVNNWKEIPGFNINLREEGVKENIRILDFSQDGKYMMLVKGNGIEVKEVSTGRMVQKIYHAKLRHYALDLRKEFLVTDSQDRTLKIWEMSSGLEVARMSLDAEVASLAFSPDGRWLATTSADHTVRIWGWQPQDMIIEACSRLTSQSELKGVDKSTCPGS